jgi:hypothetical protein
MESWKQETKKLKEVELVMASIGDIIYTVLLLWSWAIVIG